MRKAQLYFDKGYIVEIKWRKSYGVPVLTGICKIEIVNSAENKEKFRFRIAKLFSNLFAGKKTL